MSKRNYELFITDIKNCTDKIMKYVEDKSFSDFINTQILIDAVVRNIEIIGEAVKNLPDEIKEKSSDIDWRKIASLRDIVIHEYFGIDYDILWDIIKNKIPDLNIKIQEIKITDKL